MDWPPGRSTRTYQQKSLMLAAMLRLSPGVLGLKIAPNIGGFSSQTNNWFSTDPPNGAVLWSLDTVPPISLLRELENDFPQHNQFWTLWIAQVGVLYSHWHFFAKLIGSRMLKTNGRTVWNGLEMNLDIFAHVAWNTVHPGTLEGQLDWTRLADDEWLSAFLIDFTRNVFGHGDPFRRKSAAREFITHLTKYLDYEFPGGFQNLGDILPHPRHVDFVHCGIYTVNTVEHALFKTPLISFDNCRFLPMEWLHAPLCTTYRLGRVYSIGLIAREVRQKPANKCFCTTKALTSGRSTKRKVREQTEHEEYHDLDGFEGERYRRDLLIGRKRAKEILPRKFKTTADERQAILENDPHNR
ncbi:hypothetical protein B0H14DRAFT_2586201 [Mycena olivaceomarginata]|nr:hypothetical protein B0H14DRAFT_2586201 [Mycena olivaceomarginata]